MVHPAADTARPRDDQPGGRRGSLHALEELRRYGRSLELWARVHGVSVLLLSTDDAIRHGQVRRALVRALNDRDQESSPEAGPTTLAAPG